jgi:hypothetical protein
VLVFIFQLISASFAQNFFPLNVGNIYEVKNEWLLEGPGGFGESGTDYYSFSIIEDSIINGETFFKFSSNYGNQPFKREYWFNYDSLNQKLIIKLPNDTSLRLAVDFNTPPDSHYTSYLLGTPILFLSEGIAPSIVLGDTHYVYSMFGSQSIDHYVCKFADQIGLSFFKAYGGSPPVYYQAIHTIISAIIDSTIFHRLVANIDSLYPTFDRPVDTFPYLLTIPYTASYSALVDSFYLDVEHFRSDTLVQIKKYNLSKSNPSHVSLYLNGLLEGDKLKLRATITDTSIYYNSDHYPDTGWVVMNILPPILNVENENIPQFYELAQNYPNPFNPITRIRYQLPEPAFVTIKVYDVLGNEIESLLRDEKIAGSYEVEFDGSALTSGIYYYRITEGNFSQTKKMILLK